MDIKVKYNEDKSVVTLELKVTRRKLASEEKKSWGLEDAIEILKSKNVAVEPENCLSGAVVRNYSNPGDATGSWSFSLKTENTKDKTTTPKTSPKRNTKKTKAV